MNRSWPRYLIASSRLRDLKTRTRDLEAVNDQSESWGWSTYPSLISTWSVMGPVFTWHWFHKMLFARFKSLNFFWMLPLALMDNFLTAPPSPAYWFDSASLLIYCLVLLCLAIWLGSENILLCMDTGWYHCSAKASIQRWLSGTVTLLSKYLSTPPSFLHINNESIFQF